jgi:hypothetical protein
LSDEVVALSDYKQEETYRHVFSLAFGSWTEQKTSDLDFLNLFGESINAMRKDAVSINPHEALLHFKNSVRTSKRTPHFTISVINWLTLFKEIIAG